ncbi:MAG: ABC transporter permease subunit [Planctomycetota bacterium]
MKTESDPAPPRPTGRSSRTASLAARCEPMLWLTGGALSVCLFMIVGLLALVAVQGGQTFWPRPVAEVRLATADGEGVVRGEVVDVSTFTIDRDTAGSLAEPQMSKADELLGDTSASADVGQTLLRVDNKDIAGQPFRYVTDLDAAAETVTASTTYPPEIAVVERLEWGRLIGVPVAYRFEAARPISGDEEAVASAIGVVASVSAAAGPAAEAVLTRLRDRLEQRRAENDADSAGRILESLPTAIRNDVEADTADAPGGVARFAWTGDAAWPAFEALAPRWERLRNEIERIRVEMTRQAEAELEAARRGVKRYDLDHGTRLGPPSRAAAAKNAAAGEWRRLITTRRDAADFVTRSLRDDRDAVAAVTAAIEAEIGGLEARIAAAEAEIAAILAETEDAARPVVDRFLRAGLAVDESARAYRQEVARLEQEAGSASFVFEVGDGREFAQDARQIVRAYRPNALDGGGRFAIFRDRWVEFLTAEPREANTEGGVLPAIWGTVAMTLVMTLFVVPFGVLAALYLREYAKGGVVVSAIRVAVNNLAGVPSIVFGVFGLGFFIYRIGSFVDAGPRGVGWTAWDWGTWLAAAAGFAVVVAAGLGVWYAGLRTAWTRSAGATQAFLALLVAAWIGAVVFTGIAVVGHVPFFGGLFPEVAGGVYGRGGVLWASLTLALLTLPVVIVATEEALAAVPNSMREGSYACGASKWQTIRRIVLPRALPGVMTGTILAVARGAGEVAPLMLVGAVKIAPELPVSGEFPFLHPERRFMHLGFHIFDLGFQSPDSEAAKPMVYTTTLLLITIVALLNVVAIALRARLRKRFEGSQF